MCCDKGSIAEADESGVAWGRLALRVAAIVVLVGLTGPSILWTSPSYSTSLSQSLSFLLAPVLVRASLVGGRLPNVGGCGVVEEVGLVVPRASMELGDLGSDGGGVPTRMREEDGGLLALATGTLPATTAEDGEAPVEAS